MIIRDDWNTNVVNPYSSDSPRTQELLKSLTSRPRVPPRAPSGSPTTTNNGPLDPYQRNRTEFIRYDDMGGRRTPPIRESQSVNGFGKGDGAPKKQRSQKRVMEKGGGQKKQPGKQHSFPINTRRKLEFVNSDDK